MICEDGRRLVYALLVVRVLSCSFCVLIIPLLVGSRVGMGNKQPPSGFILWVETWKKIICVSSVGLILFWGFYLMKHSREYLIFSSVGQSCPTFCDPRNCSTPGLPVHHQLPESAQTHVHRIDDAIQPSHPLSCPSPPVLTLSQHQGLFKWVNSLHQVAKVIGVSASSSVLPMNIQDWLSLGWKS